MLKMEGNSEAERKRVKRGLFEKTTGDYIKNLHLLVLIFYYLKQRCLFLFLNLHHGL